MQDHTAVFLEHYPLHEKELELVANWQQDKIIVYNSLDEAIGNSYVTQSITRGQQKIAGLVSIEQSASSQEEWMQKNIKAVVRYNRWGAMV